MNPFKFQSVVGMALCATIGTTGILGSDRASAAATASLSASPGVYSAGSAVTFTITMEFPEIVTTAISGPVTDYYASGYYIDLDFGDGSPLLYFTGYDNQASFQHTHTYATPGVFTAAFTGNAEYLGSFPVIEQVGTNYDACDAYGYYPDCAVPVYGTVYVTDGFNEPINAFTQVTVTAVPEPATYAMLLTGLGLLGAVA